MQCLAAVCKRVPSDARFIPLRRHLIREMTLRAFKTVYRSGLSLHDSASMDGDLPDWLAVVSGAEIRGVIFAKFPEAIDLPELSTFEFFADVVVPKVVAGEAMRSVLSLYLETLPKFDIASFPVELSHQSFSRALQVLFCDDTMNRHRRNPQTWMARFSTVLRGCLGRRSEDVTTDEPPFPVVREEIVSPLFENTEDACMHAKLAAMLHLTANRNQCDELVGRAAGVRKSLFGDRDPDALHFCHTLAEMCLQNNRIDFALDMLQQALVTTLHPTSSISDLYSLVINAQLCAVAHSAKGAHVDAVFWCDQVWSLCRSLSPNAVPVAPASGLGHPTEPDLQEFLCALHCIEGYCTSVSEPGSFSLVKRWLNVYRHAGNLVSFTRLTDAACEFYRQRLSGRVDIDSSISLWPSLTAVTERLEPYRQYAYLLHGCYLAIASYEPEPSGMLFEQLRSSGLQLSAVIDSAQCLLRWYESSLPAFHSDRASVAFVNFQLQAASARLLGQSMSTSTFGIGQVPSAAPVSTSIPGASSPTADNRTHDPSALNQGMSEHLHPGMPQEPLVFMVHCMQTHRTSFNHQQVMVQGTHSLTRQVSLSCTARSMSGSLTG